MAVWLAGYSYPTAFGLCVQDLGYAPPRTYQAPDSIQTGQRASSVKLPARSVSLRGISGRTHHSSFTKKYACAEEVVLRRTRELPIGVVNNCESSVQLLTLREEIPLVMYVTQPVKSTQLKECVTVSFSARAGEQAPNPRVSQCPPRLHRPRHLAECPLQIYTVYS